MGTDLDEARKGPQIEFSLGGIARDLVREIPLSYKMNGALVDLGDGQGPQQLSGAAFILNALAQRFMPLEEEMNLRAMADLHGFVRLPGETVDQLLIRFEVIVQRARTRSGLPVQNTHAAWMLLLALRLPSEYWVHLLTPFRGALPSTDTEYRQFLEYVKRFGHLAEAGSYSINHGATMGPSTMATWNFPTVGGDGNAAQQQPQFAGLAGGAQFSQPTNNVFTSHQQTGLQNYDFDDSDTSDDDEAAGDETFLEFPPANASSNEQAAHYYQRYKAYKRKYRQTTERAPRRFRGSTRRRTFLANGRCMSMEQGVYFGSTGAPGANGGSFRRSQRGNPTGRDGSKLKCHNCGSEDHLLRACPTARSTSRPSPATMTTGFATDNLMTRGEQRQPFRQGPLADVLRTGNGTHFMTTAEAEMDNAVRQPVPNSPPESGARTSMPEQQQIAPMPRPMQATSMFEDNNNPVREQMTTRTTQASATWTSLQTMSQSQSRPAGEDLPLAVRTVETTANVESYTASLAVMSTIARGPPHTDAAATAVVRRATSASTAIMDMMNMQRRLETDRETRRDQRDDDRQARREQRDGGKGYGGKGYGGRGYGGRAQSLPPRRTSRWHQDSIHDHPDDEELIEDYDDDNDHERREDELGDYVMVATNATETRSYYGNPAQDKCVVCLDRLASHMLLPCRHAHFCGECCDFLIGGATDSMFPECPVCRARIDSAEEAETQTIMAQRAVRLHARSMAESYASLLRRCMQRPAATSPSSTGPNDGVVRSIFGPWWPAEADTPEDPELFQHYISALSLADGEVGLLPDTGAHDGLCGSHWAVSQAKHCQTADKPLSQRPLKDPRTVQGVGKGSQQAEFEVTLTCGLQDVDGNFHEQEYTAPCLDDSHIPGLMGIKSLKNLDALIRCKTGEMWFLGSGGATIRTSPGSKHFQMKEARSGHWLLPVSKFGKNATKITTALPTADVPPPVHKSSALPSTVHKSSVIGSTAQTTVQKDLAPPIAADV